MARSLLLHVASKSGILPTNTLKLLVVRPMAGNCLLATILKPWLVLVKSHAYQLSSRSVGLNPSHFSCQSMQTSKQFARSDGDDEVSV